MASSFFSISSIKNLYAIARFHSLTGAFLSFFPAGLGLLLAYEEENDLIYIPIFLIISILIRGAGCIINDILDQKYDKHVERTKNRPLASGRMPQTHALIWCVILLSICSLSFLIISFQSIVISCITMIMISLYPLCKRFMKLPQIFLAVTINMGLFIAYTNIKDSISFEAVILYIGCCFWTLAYDTIYAFMDVKDDKKIGINSSALFFKHNSIKSTIALFYGVFFSFYLLATFQFSTIYSLIALLSNLLLTFWILFFFPTHNTENNIQKIFMCFKANSLIGFIFFSSMLLEKIL